jgi:RHS repeat-associated protein
VVGPARQKTHRIGETGALKIRVRRKAKAHFEVSPKHHWMGAGRATLTLPNGIVTQYGYDDNNQVTSIAYRNGATTIGDLTYTYDAVGRRTAIDGSSARTGLPQTVASTSYDAANELMAWGGDSRQYDANGSLASDGLTSYTWDSRQRLAGTSGLASANFAYDATGRRIAATLGGVATQYFYDGLNTVAETKGTQTTSLLAGTDLDEWLARIDLTGSQSFLTDALGSTVALTDSVANVTTQYTYDAFGNTAVQGSPANSARFTGRDQDEAGSYYFRARYYRPNEGRFSSEDPIRLVPSESLYAYADDDPARLKDPTGRLVGPLPLQVGPAALVYIDVLLIVHDINLLHQLCEAYGWCTPSKPKPGSQCLTKSECWDRYMNEKAFCSRYFGTELYSMCRSRAQARYEACRDGLDPDGPGPLDPLKWPDAPHRR